MDARRGGQIGISSFALLVLCFGCIPLVSAAPPQETAITALPLRQQEERGFDHFYNLEYDQAITVFQKLRDGDPGNSRWYNHLAASYFYKQLFIAGVLQGDLFASSNKFFRNKKFDPDPTLKKNFWDANNEAIRLCEQKLKQDRKNEDALYDCGVAYADRASYQGLVDRSKVETLTSARKANFYHSELIRINPRCYDAYLIPGIYDYVLGSLPGSMKFLLFFGGFSGDKVHGIQSVETAANWGDRSKQDAKILLAVMYRREKQYADARRVLGELSQAFPRNYIFPLELASIDRSAGDEKEAIRVYEQVLNAIHEGKPGYANAPLARIHYELGELYWKAGDLQSAKSELEQVRGSLGSTPDLENENALKRQQIEEALHQRDGETPRLHSCCATP